jgi:hypothetical protein
VYSRRQWWRSRVGGVKDFVAVNGIWLGIPEGEALTINGIWQGIPEGEAFKT